MIHETASAWYPGWDPIGEEGEEGSIRVSRFYGEDSTDGWRAWNGTLFPSSEAQELFRIWNYYDHASVWHKLSFEFKQSSLNTIISSHGDSNDVRISLAIFDMTQLNTERYPNEFNDSWKFSYFGQRNCYVNSTSGDYICKRSAFELILSQESKDNGVDDYTIRNWYNDTVYLTFPIVDVVDEWVELEVIFKLDSNENVPACDTCYPAFYIQNNGWPQWNTNISWSMRNVVFERLSNDVIEETPITDFYSEVVDIPRMDSLSTVEAQGWDRIDCPHEESNLYEWHDASTWSSGVVPDTTMENITLPVGKSVIVRSCSSIANETNPYQRVMFVCLFV